MWDFIKKPWVMVTIAVIVAAMLEAKFRLFSGAYEKASGAVKGAIPSTAVAAPAK